MYDELFFFPTISYISSSSFPPPFLLFCQYYYIFIVFLVVFKIFKFLNFLFSPTFANFRQYLLSFFLFSYYLLFYFCHSIGNNSLSTIIIQKKRNESALLVQYTLVIMCTLQSCSQRENKNCFLQI